MKDIQNAHWTYMDSKNRRMPFSSALGALLSALMVFGGVFPAHAAAPQDIYWVTDTTIESAGGNGSGSRSQLASSVGFKVVATDYEYLYFFTSSGNLTRANLDGTNPTVLIASVNNPSGIAVTDTHIYFTRWSAGVFAVAKVSPGTPVQIDNIGGTYFQGLTVDDGKIFVNVWTGQSTSGLWHATLNALTPVSFSKSPYSNEFLSWGSSSIYSHGGFLYATSAQGKIYKIAANSWNQPISSWTALDYSSFLSQQGLSTSFWGVTVLGPYLYFTTVGSLNSTTVGSVVRSTTFGESPTLLQQFGSSSYGIAVAPGIYTVSYDANGGLGSPMTSQSARLPIQLSQLTFSREGYIFGGWRASTDNAIYADEAMYTHQDTVTMVARWVGETHVISYSSEGGSNVANGSFRTGGSTTLPSGPTRNGYTFTGWYEQPQGGTALTSPYSPSGAGDLTLYAQWAPSYTAPPSYLGPILPCEFGSLSAPTAGKVLTFGGKRLETVSSGQIDGKDVEVLERSATVLKIALPNLASGSYDLVLQSAFGKLTLQNCIKVSAAANSITPAPPSSPSASDELPSINKTPFIATKRFFSFIGDRGQLVAKDARAIEKWLSGFDGVTHITCVGSTSGIPVIGTDPALAKTRARNACGLVSRLVAEATVKHSYVNGRGIGQYFRAVQITIQGER